MLLKEECSPSVSSNILHVGKDNTTTNENDGKLSNYVKDIKLSKEMSMRHQDLSCQILNHYLVMVIISKNVVRFVPNSAITFIQSK